MSKDEIINNIINRDIFFGDLCLEAENSYKEGNYFSSIICLFIIAEQIIKFSLNADDGNYRELLIEASTQKIIRKKEFIDLNNLRFLRNKILHKNNYSLGIEAKGIFFPFYEMESKKIVYEKFSKNIFSIVLKVLNR